MGAMKVDPASTPTTRTLRLTVSTRTTGETVTARVDSPASAAVPVRAQRRPRVPGLLLAHGANNDLDHPLLASLAGQLARDGVATVLRFNFPYAERGSTSPDARPVLEDTFRRAYHLLVHELLEPGTPVFLGGKSLGGRFAAEFVSGGIEGEALPADGLVVLDAEEVERTIRLRDGEAEHSYSKDLQMMAIQNARAYRPERTRITKPHRILDPKHGPLIAVRLNICTRKTLGGLILAAFVWRWRSKVNDETGQPHHRFLWSLGSLLAVLLVGYLVLGQPFRLTWPTGGSIRPSALGGRALGR